MGLIHWWPLNGNLKDYGIKNVTLTSSGATSDNNGKIGKCYKLTNTAGTISRTELDYSTKSISFGGWFKFNQAEIAEILTQSITTSTATTPTGQLFGNDSYGGMALVWNSNNIYSSGSFTSLSVFATQRDANQNKSTTSQTITFDTWYHFMLVWNLDTLTLSFYVNGVLKGSQTFANVPILKDLDFILNRNNIYGGNGPTRCIPMRVNDFRCYDHALSVKEIKEISKGLVLHYNFETSENKNLLYDTKSVTGDSGTDLTITDYTYNGIKGYRLQKTTNSGWGSFLRWVTNYQILDVNKKYSFSVDVVSLNGSNYSIGNFIANDNSNNVFITNSSKTATTTLQRLKWENLTPNSSFTKEERVNNVGWHLILNTVPLDIFIANPKLEVGDICTTFTPYMTNSNNTSDYDDGKTIYDNSGNGYNGITNGALRILGNSPSGKHCAKFDSNVYIEPSGLPEFKQATYSFWVKIPTAENAYRAVFIPKNGPTNAGIWLSVNCESSGVWTYQGGNSPNYCRSGGSMLSANSWHLISYTFKDGVGQCYLDGQAIGQSITYTTRTYIPTGNYTLGDSYTGTSWSGTPFDGYIADFKIYSTALSAEDILAEYDRRISIDRNGNFYSDEFVEEDGANTSVGKTGVTNTNVIATTMTLDDGSIWIPICMHYVPDGLNTSRSNKYCYTSRNIWTTFGIINDAERPESGYYEFYVMQQTAVNGAFSWFRFKQNINPFSATWADVNPSTVGTNVTRISASTTNNYAGMYWMNNSSAAMCFANGSNGNWYGCGIQAAYQGGIPGYNGQTVLGWQVVYMRVTKTCAKMFKNGLVIANNITEL